MPSPHLDPHVADHAPSEQSLTDYDRGHLITYLRLLDAEAEGADWREVAAIVLHLDPARDPQRTEAAWRSHLRRAQWMTRSGYRHLLHERQAQGSG